ncbi:unnamed protein product [Urochloa humidicola]
MALRRFVYLVTDDLSVRQFLLRRIDMSRFFLPTRHEPGRPPPPLEEAGRLPRPAMKFMAPLSNKSSEARLHFMIVPGADFAAGDGVVVSGGRADDKVIVSDQTGRNLLYDAGYHTVRTLCGLTAPKLSPVSVSAAGGNLYVLDAVLMHGGGSFDVIIRDDPYRSFSDADEWMRSITTVREDWRCEPLPPPPSPTTTS